MLLGTAAQAAQDGLWGPTTTAALVGAVGVVAASLITFAAAGRIARRESTLRIREKRYDEKRALYMSSLDQVTAVRGGLDAQMNSIRLFGAGFEGLKRDYRLTAPGAPLRALTLLIETCQEIKDKYELVTQRPFEFSQAEKENLRASLAYFETVIQDDFARHDPDTSVPLRTRLLKRITPARARRAYGI